MGYPVKYPHDHNLFTLMVSHGLMWLGYRQNIPQLRKLVRGIFLPALASQCETKGR